MFFWGCHNPYVLAVSPRRPGFHSRCGKKDFWMNNIFSALYGCPGFFEYVIILTDLDNKFPKFFRVLESREEYQQFDKLFAADFPFWSGGKDFMQCDF